MMEFTKSNEIPYIGVDEYWQRTRETDLHIMGHVFHPNETGHRRMAEQIAQSLSKEGFLPTIPNRFRLVDHLLLPLLMFSIGMVVEEDTDSFTYWCCSPASSGTV